MPACPRCLSLIDGDLAYCPVCGRPRIVEGLRAPVPPPAWQTPVQQALLVIAVLWLLVTVGVAFLREWKAVRAARELLAVNQPQLAWDQLRPFLEHHPEHAQGLLLCGQATIRLGLMVDAGHCYAKLGAVAPELAKPLAAEYQRVLTERARGLGCNPEGFGNLLAGADNLGAAFVPSVLAGLDRVVEACRLNQYQYQRYQLVSVLNGKVLGRELVTSGYVPAIGRSLAVGRYNMARLLAIQGQQLEPAQAPAIEAALEPERQRVSATIATTANLCATLRNDVKFHTGSAYCFPATVPAAAQAAKDGWGRPVLYYPQGQAGAQGCSSGFAIFSYGVRGVLPNERLSPAAGIGCRFFNNTTSWQLPNAFWMAKARPAANPGQPPATPAPTAGEGD
jgi:hypothetical protein